MRSLRSFSLTLFVAVAFIATATATPTLWDSWQFPGSFNINDWLPKPDANGRYPISTASGNNIQFSQGSWFGDEEVVYSDEKYVQLRADQDEQTLEFSYPQDGSSYVKISGITVSMRSDENMETRLYVADGGINQDHIKLQLNVNNSHNFHYTLKIYGTRS